MPLKQKWLPEDFKNEHWPLGYSAASMADIAEMLSTQLDMEIKPVPLSPDVFYESSVAAGGDPAYLACIRDQFRMSATGALKNLEKTFDTSKFEQAVGRAPATWETHILNHLNALKTVASAQ